jgi:hypothetical protein
VWGGVETLDGSAAFFHVAANFAVEGDGGVVIVSVESVCTIWMMVFGGIYNVVDIIDVEGAVAVIWIETVFILAWLFYHLFWPRCLRSRRFVLVGAENIVACIKLGKEFRVCLFELGHIQIFYCE